MFVLARKLVLAAALLVGAFGALRLVVPPKPAWVAGSLQNCSVPPVLLVPQVDDVRYCASASRNQAYEGAWILAAAGLWAWGASRLLKQAEDDLDIERAGRDAAADTPLTMRAS